MTPTVTFGTQFVIREREFSKSKNGNFPRKKKKVANQMEDGNIQAKDVAALRHSGSSGQFQLM